jgi:tetratricopeptide (TPR) repeat protein
MPLQEQADARLSGCQTVKNGFGGISCGWAALLLAGLASAAEPVAEAVKAEASTGLEVKTKSMAAAAASKLRLIDHQLTQSSLTQRIQQSPHADAGTRLTEARALYERAQLEFNAGQFGIANNLADDSLRLIVVASRLAPDTAQRLAQEKTRNTELREAIRTFNLLYQSLGKRMAEINAHSPLGDAELVRVNGMVDKADALIAIGNHHEAHVLLNSAHLIVVSTLNRMLMAQTIVYDLKFESPAEEFRYEVARNIGFEELIPVALERLVVTRETANLAERYVQQSRDLRNAAQKLASDGQFLAALKNIQEASALLQRSLRIAGVVVPQTPELTR